MTTRPQTSIALVSAVFALHCGGTSFEDSEGGGGSGATSGAGATTSTGSAMGGATTGNGPSTNNGSATSSTTGAGGGIADPGMDGPFTFAPVSGSAMNPESGGMVAVKGFVPTAGPSSGPYPVVIIAHGFQIAATQYDTYAERLASFGYVALNVDFQASLFSVNNVENANDLIGAIDWAGSAPELAGKADLTKVGTTGHSMGGKLALLAATLDPRVKASITLDPVDGAMNCSAANCPDVSDKMPMLNIPTAFLGELLDSSAGGFGMACAPAANNFETFYAGAKSPSLSINVLGANHMSFIEDPSSCFSCGFCKMATAQQAQVLGIAKSYVVAFYERYLKGITEYDTYLTGAEANARYVTPGQISIQSK
jgi:predicted dienelactone hydrolase